MVPSKAWAQAVRVDGTVIVLNSGNYEFVCLRHRATKTLYVSDLIEPPKCSDPGYGKLHVGIYIAAVQDSIDRMTQPASAPASGFDNSSTGGDGPGGNCGGEGEPRGKRGRAKSGGSQGNTGNKVADVCESVAVKVCLFGPYEHSTKKSPSRWPRTEIYSSSTFDMAFIIRESPPRSFALHLPSRRAKNFLLCFLRKPSALVEMRIVL